jgi:hypothetical protein
LEPEAREQSPQRFLIGPRVAELLEVARQRHVALDDGQLAAEARQIRILPQQPGQPLGPADVLHALQLVEAAQKSMHRSEAGNQSGGRLLTDPFDPGDVVDRVAHEADEIDDLLGRHPEASFDGSLVEPAIAHRVPQAHVPVDELHQILVAGDDHRLRPLRRHPTRQGADDVVGLDPGDRERTQAEGRDDFPQHRDLRGQFVGNRGAVRLVVVEQLVPEGRTGRIEDGADVLRSSVAQELE